MVHTGQQVLDIGCGPGFFTIPLAQMVGEEGSVLAVDLQQEMLERVYNNALKQRVLHRIMLHRSSEHGIGTDFRADFALAFYMLHEALEPETLLDELHRIVKPAGRLLIAVPKLYVGESEYAELLALACRSGFDIAYKPKIWFSRTALLEKR